MARTQWLYLISAPSGTTGAAWRLGVTQWLGWNHLEFYSLPGCWCWLSAGTPVGLSARALTCRLFVWFLNLFTAWWLGFKSKCLRRTSLECIPFYDPALKVTKQCFGCSYRPTLIPLEGKSVNIIKWEEYVGRDISSQSFYKNIICHKNQSIGDKAVGIR